MKSKKVLIIAYYWPPAGGPGVQRWLKFVKYLSDFDIEPVVYVPENATYPITDESLLNEIPSNITILKQPIKEPYALASMVSKKQTKSLSSGIITSEKKQSLLERLLLFVRGNFFIPDARASWVRPSVDFLGEYLDNNNINTIITTGPPHSVHLIGLRLKAQLKLNWIADFRDPWTTIGYHKALKLMPYAKNKHLRLEHEVLNNANHIIVTSQLTKTEFSTKTKQPISIITNGFDNLGTIITPKKTDFVMAHIGSLLSKRNPVTLWKVLSELVTTNTEFKNHFRLELAGIISQEVLDSIEHFGLTAYTKNLGYLSHQDAQKLQRSAQVLLLIEIDSEDTKAIIPGKLFEYMVSNTPILAIGPKDADVSIIIKETNTGIYAASTDEPTIKQHILEYFTQYQNNTLETHPIGLEKYSRKMLTKRLSEIIKWE